METSKNITGLIKLQNILKYTYGLVPIVAGADKFLNLLTQWDHYLSPVVNDILPGVTFMKIVGIVEIIAGIVVLIKTDLGAYIVAAWLVVIALSLIFTGHHFDIAVRDLVMALGAIVLARLTTVTKSNFQLEG